MCRCPSLGCRVALGLRACSWPLGARGLFHVTRQGNAVKEAAVLPGMLAERRWPVSLESARFNH